MFCPICKCEFRPGFERCESCNTDLVADLAQVDAQPEKPTTVASSATVPMAEYCGFFDLEEARSARQSVLDQGIATDILIRSTAEAGEEYWLRVEVAKFRLVPTILGYDQASPSEEEDGFECGECGYRVAAAESFCPACGASFEGE